MVQVRYDKPIPAVGQWWKKGQYAYEIQRIVDGNHVLRLTPTRVFEVRAEALAEPEWQCVGLTLPGGKIAMVGEMWAATGSPAGPFRLDALVQRGPNVEFVVSHRGDDGRWTPPSYVGPAFMAGHCSRVAETPADAPMHHILVVGGASIALDAPVTFPVPAAAKAEFVVRGRLAMLGMRGYTSERLLRDAMADEVNVNGWVLRGLDVCTWPESQAGKVTLTFQPHPKLGLASQAGDSLRIGDMVCRAPDGRNATLADGTPIGVIADATPDAAGRIKVNISVGSGANFASTATLASEAASRIFAGALDHLRRDESRADDTKEGKVTTFASLLRKHARKEETHPEAITAFTVPGSARVSMLGPVKATVRPNDVAAVLRRYADRMGQPFAGMSAASRKHLARVCGDTAHAIAALMEPRRGDVANCTARAEDAARAAQHGAAMVATLTVLDMTGATVDGERETDLVEQVSSQAVYACGLATARRAQ